MRIAKDSYIQRILVLFSGNILAQIIPFLLAPLITRLYTPEELGIQGNFIALVSILSIVANGRYDLAVVLPKEDKKAINIVALGIKISLIVSVLSLGLLLFKKQITAFYETEILVDYLPLVSVVVFIIAIHNLWVQWLVRKELFKEISIVKITLSLFTNGLFVLFGWLKYGVFGLIIGFVIGFAIATLLLYFYSAKSFNKKAITKSLQWEMLKTYKDFPLINSLHAFSDLFFSEFLILALITHYYGLVATGLYVVMIKYLKAPIRFLGGAIGQVFYKETARLKQENQITVSVLKKTIKLSLLVVIPMFLIIYFFAPKLFAWYLGVEWREAGEYAQILIFPICLGLITSPISSIPLIYHQQKKSFTINFFGMLFSILIFYWAISAAYSLTQSLAFFAWGQSIYLSYLLFWYYKLSNKN